MFCFSFQFQRSLIDYHYYGAKRTITYLSRTITIRQNLGIMPQDWPLSLSLEINVTTHSSWVADTLRSDGLPGSSSEHRVCQCCGAEPGRHQMGGVGNWPCGVLWDIPKKGTGLRKPFLFVTDRSYFYWNYLWDKSHHSDSFCICQHLISLTKVKESSMTWPKQQIWVSALSKCICRSESPAEKSGLFL